MQKPLPYNPEAVFIWWFHLFGLELVEMTGISSSYSDELRLALGVPFKALLARPPAGKPDRTGYRSVRFPINSKFG